MTLIFHKLEGFRSKAEGSNCMLIKIYMSSAPIFLNCWNKTNVVLVKLN